MYILLSLKLEILMFGKLGAETNNLSNKHKQLLVIISSSASCLTKLIARALVLLCA